MAKKIKINSSEIKEMRDIMTAAKSLTAKEKFAEMYKNNPDLNRKEAGELLSVSRQQIYNYIKEMEGKV
jgi:predicted DNA-binding protein YlxM (UPF0122 family)